MISEQKKLARKWNKETAPHSEPKKSSILKKSKQRGASNILDNNSMDYEKLTARMLKKLPVYWSSSLTGEFADLR